MTTKHFLLTVAMLTAGVTSLQAQTIEDDPIIMLVNGVPVTRSEFEYSFNKNNTDGVLDRRGIDEYVPLFVDFRLKVEEARAQGIDTLAAIREELAGYREQMVMPTLVDSQFIEREVRKVYDETAKQYEGQDLFTVSHILVLVRQDADAATQAAARARIDSIYSVLKGGAEFAEVAKACSDDKMSAVRGGELGRLAKGMTIPDFERVVFQMKAGEMSAPFLTPAGWHIALVTDRGPFEDFAFHHDAIVRFLEQRGIREQSASALVDSLVRTEGLTRQQVIDRYFAEMIANDQEARFLAQEYNDGTLMYELCKSQIWDVAANDEAGLDAFFRANKAQYTWDAPHFRGVIIRAKDEAAMKAAKRAIKGVKEEDWAKTIVEALNTDSVKLVRVEHGIFKLGDNKVIDKLVFKVKDADFKPHTTYPVTDVVGKKLKAPQTWRDVKGLVTTDYQNMREHEWVETLRQKYPVVIFNDVVQTVNNH